MAAIPLRRRDVVTLDDGTRAVVVGIAVGIVQVMTLSEHRERVWLPRDTVKRRDRVTGCDL